MEKEKKTNTFEDKDKLIARFQKLAKAINKYGVYVHFDKLPCIG